MHRGRCSSSQPWPRWRAGQLPPPCRRCGGGSYSKPAAPPRITHVHPEYEEMTAADVLMTVPPTDMVIRSFFFSPREISALRKYAPPHLRSTSSRFDLITASVWRSRTAALGYDPDDDVRVMIVVNARGRRSPPLPSGFYGNAVAFPVASSAAGMLTRSPLGYALELVKKAKATVTDEYMQSVMDLMVLRGRPCTALTRTFFVSDLTRVAFEAVDVGWGEALFGGNAFVWQASDPVLSCFYTRHKNRKGVESILLPMCLPGPAMERFQAEMENLIKEPAFDAVRVEEVTVRRMSSKF